MHADRRIAKVFIVDGCTVSNACQTTCPEVFEVLESGVRILDDAERHFAPKREAIERAADGCPLEAIRIEYEDGTLFQRSG